MFWNRILVIYSTN